MTTAMFGYVVNDALIKWVAEDLPLFQSIFLRGCAIVVLLLAIVRARGARLSRNVITTRPLQLRVTMEAIGTVLYLLALTNVPLASLSAILQLVPIAVTFAAARLLREAVSPIRVVSVIAGFIGVLFIIRPGSDDFSPWFLGGLATVAIVIVRELATRDISSDIPGSVAALMTGIVITVMGLFISVFQGWETPSTIRILALVAAAGFLSLGYVGSINAVRSGDISFTAPFRYTILLFAIILQIVIFGDVPDTLTFVGAAIIAGAGLLSLRSQPQVAPQPDNA
jgi:drug/metabolite transporter (DMT)-like permease